MKGKKKKRKQEEVRMGLEEDKRKGHSERRIGGVWGSGYSIEGWETEG